MIDWNKPIQTRDGRPARLICSDFKHPCSEKSHIVIVAHQDEKESTLFVDSNGRYYSLVTSSDYDIINVPPPKIKLNRTFYLYRDEDNQARLTGHPVSNCRWVLVGKKEITIEEGEGM